MLASEALTAYGQISGMNLTAIAATGMTNAVQRLERGAAALTQPDGDRVEGMVDLITAKTQFRASAALVRVSDEMMTDLLDIQRER